MLGLQVYPDFIEGHSSTVGNSVEHCAMVFYRKSKLFL
jgi:hypothetical protein